MAFLGAEHGLQGERASVAVAHGLNVAAPGLGSIGLAVVGHGLNCSAACGIFLDQGPNLCFLHWQADSLPLSHQGSPSLLNEDHFA